jgi:hypothetical protein
MATYLLTPFPGKILPSCDVNVSSCDVDVTLCNVDVTLCCVDVTLLISIVVDSTTAMWQSDKCVLGFCYVCPREKVSRENHPLGLKPWSGAFLPSLDSVTVMYPDNTGDCDSIY